TWALFGKGEFNKSWFENQPLSWNTFLDFGANIMREVQYRCFKSRAGRAGRFETRVAAGEAGVAFLGERWSKPESWGVWSDGPTARLRLPVSGDRAVWRLALGGYCFTEGLSTKEERIVVVRFNGKSVA